MTALMMQFHTHLEPHDHARLQIASKRKGQSAAEYLRRALRAALDAEELGRGAIERVPAHRPDPALPSPGPAAPSGAA